MVRRPGLDRPTWAGDPDLDLLDPRLGRAARGVRVRRRQRRPPLTVSFNVPQGRRAAGSLSTSTREVARHHLRHRLVVQSRALFAAVSAAEPQQSEARPRLKMASATSISMRVKPDCSSSSRRTWTLPSGADLDRELRSLALGRRGNAGSGHGRSGSKRMLAWFADLGACVRSDPVRGVTPTCHWPPDTARNLIAFGTDRSARPWPRFRRSPDPAPPSPAREPPPRPAGCRPAPRHRKHHRGRRKAEDDDHDHELDQENPRSLGDLRVRLGVK